MSEEQKRQLEAQLWKIADELRGKMDADEFKDYILGFIFYKYLSEKITASVNNDLKNDGVTFKEIYQDPDYLEAVTDQCVKYLGFFLNYDLLFSTLVEKEDTSNILKDLQTAFAAIEQSTRGTDSQDEFNHLFEDLDLNSTKLGKSYNERNELLTKVLKHLNKIDFDIENPKSDILGDAYEYLIGKFAASAGKKAGEFYTPAQISTLLAKLVTIRKPILNSVYDPTCGSGSLLLRVKKEAKDVAHFYGQEMNRTTYNLSRMNMLLHDIKYKQFHLVQDDTLKNPKHLDLRFDAIVANPPFSANWDPNTLMSSDDRFSQYGKLAPKTKADYAFIQHMIHHLDESGTMAVVVPHGVLFRGAAEGHIRRYLIENRNYLDAVIGLPANIFYGTSIPTCILVFQKCRNTPENILFIDASQHFTKVKTQNVLEAKHIDQIITTYKERRSIDKYAYVAPLSEIETNEYNLNIPRYVNTFEAEAFISIDQVCADLKQLDQEMVPLNQQILSLCQELGIPAPF